ncbi:MAG: signal peptidase I [Bacilli bacterium]
MTVLENEQIVNEKRSVYSQIIGLGVIVWMMYWLVMSDMQIVRVTGHSMEPTLQNGDMLIIKPESRYERGDVIVFQSKNGTEIYVKRIVATSEESIEFRYRKLFINGRHLNARYIKEPVHASAFTQEVPNGHVFVIGDNTLDSYDSRYRSFGTVEESQIIGSVRFKI